MTGPRRDLDRFFDPRGVVIVGTLAHGTAAGVPLTQLKDRFGDRFFLVNRRGGEIEGRRVYTEVGDVPGAIDLAVISVGTSAVEDIIDECGRKGVAFALVFTAGYREVGPEGAQLERDLLAAARRNNIRLIGPNTNTNAFESMPEIANRRGGKIGLVTQSGGQGRPIVQAAAFGVAFSRWIPTGNEADLEAADFIEYFAYDDDTAVIAGYFEGFRDSRKLRNALAAANRNGKPVVALKVGRTEAGARAASSHTGHLAGSDAAIDGLFAQYGVTRVYDLDELLETAALFAKLPPDTGARVCLYTGSGGSGALMAEVAAAKGVSAPELAPATQQALLEHLPDYLIHSNPVDNGTIFAANASPRDRRQVLEILAADPAIDVIVAGIPGPLPGSMDNLVADLHAFADETGTPVVVTWNSMVTDVDSFAALVASRLPVFRSSRNCFAALRGWADHRRARPALRAGEYVPPALPTEIDRRLAGGGVRTWAESEWLLGQYGIQTVPTVIASTPEQAGAAAERLGPTVVLKLASRQFPHRSDVGLVRLGVAGPDGARSVARELVDRAKSLDPDAEIEGVLVQRQVPAGIEMIAGLFRDPVLGTCLLLGTGGVTAEVMRDVSIRPVPITDLDLEEMIAELRGGALLRGVRGTPPADIDALYDLLHALARLGEECGEVVVELDLNPVIVHSTGLSVVDAFVVGRVGRPGEYG